jgi:hypothetical protein
MFKNFIKTSFLMLFISCSNKTKVSENKDAITQGYKSFGNQISNQNAVTAQAMIEKYQLLKEGDTVGVKFTSTIKEVCQNKGCWMKLDLGNNKESFVKFKDYAFFMPKDSKNDQVIVNGKAFVSMESIEDQKHYAQDAGISQNEIDKITQPKPVYSFIADGVLIKK